MKIVINSYYGGFGLSEKAFARYNELSVKNYYYEYDIPRDDPVLVSVVEEFGADVNNKYSRLKIVEIPDGVAYTIEEHDGNEWIAEYHRTWR